mmetsp:Transcript_4605/g.14599  ORF Transcript_4605/g.14599 Transcript_4605/m.14599 type:complete len:115 (+) Transcript_4605:945-1289(+)
MSFKQEHVKLKDDDVEGHTDTVRKHLTMRYNIKELRKLAEFESWIIESLEELIPDDDRRPVIELATVAKTSEAKMVKQLQKLLGSRVAEADRQHFIDEFVYRFNKLPRALIENL